MEGATGGRKAGSRTVGETVGAWLVSEECVFIIA